MKKEKLVRLQTWVPASYKKFVVLEARKKCVRESAINRKALELLMDKVKNV